MSALIELVVILGFIGAVVWLPEALIARRTRRLHTPAKPNPPARPCAGPAMDLF